MAPGDLQEVLAVLRPGATPPPADLLVGLGAAADAAAYRLPPDLAIVETVHCFPPVACDPATACSSPSLSEPASSRRRRRTASRAPSASGPRSPACSGSIAWPPRSRARAGRRARPTSPDSVSSATPERW